MANHRSNNDPNKPNPATPGTSGPQRLPTDRIVSSYTARLRLPGIQVFVATVPGASGSQAQLQNFGGHGQSNHLVIASDLLGLLRFYTAGSAVSLIAAPVSSNLQTLNTGEPASNDPATSGLLNLQRLYLWDLTTSNTATAGPLGLQNIYPQQSTEDTASPGLLGLQSIYTEGQATTSTVKRASRGKRATSGKAKPGSSGRKRSFATEHADSDPGPSGCQSVSTQGPATSVAATSGKSGVRSRSSKRQASTNTPKRRSYNRRRGSAKGRINCTPASPGSSDLQNPPTERQATGVMAVPGPSGLQNVSQKRTATSDSATRGRRGHGGASRRGRLSSARAKSGPSGRKRSKKKHASTEITTPQPSGQSNVSNTGRATSETTAYGPSGDQDVSQTERVTTHMAIPGSSNFRCSLRRIVPRIISPRPSVRRSDPQKGRSKSGGGVAMLPQGSSALQRYFMEECASTIDSPCSPGLEPFPLSGQASDEAVPGPSGLQGFVAGGTPDLATPGPSGLQEFFSRVPGSISEQTSSDDSEDVDTDVDSDSDSDSGSGSDSDSDEDPPNPSTSRTYTAQRTFPVKRSRKTDHCCHMCDHNYSFQPCPDTLPRKDLCRVKCPSCPKRFKTKRSLKVHLKSIHHIVKPYYCTVCLRGFSTEDQLVNHFRKLHPHRSVEPFICYTCRRGFSNLEALREHRRTAHIRANRISCPRQGCGKAYSSLKTLRRHLLNVHDKITQYSRRPFPCHLCPRRFRFEATLREHLRHQHCDEKERTCVHCKQTFLTRTDLKSHLTMVQSYKREHTCPACGQFFPMNCVLRKHLVNVHDSFGRFACSECGAVFGVRHMLARHVKTFHPFYDLRCHSCDLIFPSLQELQNHLDEAHKVVVLPAHA